MAKNKAQLDAMIEPQSRSEEFLNYICGRSVDVNLLPNPQSRMEEYLEYIALNFGGSNGISPGSNAANIAYNDTNQVGKTNVQDMLDYLETDKVKARPKKSFIICVAGQSNAVGFDESEHTRYSTTNLNPNRLRQLGIYDGDNLKNIPLGVHAHSFQDMRNMTNLNPNGTKGIHLPLGNLLLNEIPEDYEILFVSATYGGTGFTGNASFGTMDANTLKPSRGILRWGVNSAYYLSMKNRIKYALDLNEENIFGGVVWIQGENDNGNPDTHKTEFIRMTDDFFAYFNDNNYGNRVAKGIWDKDLWYNVETVAHWYKQAGCVEIWNNYKAWNSKTYVKVPRYADCNTTNVTSSRNPQSHFGHNAFIKYVAPRVLAKMKENGTLFKKHFDSIDFDTTIDATKFDATSSSFESVGTNSAFTFDDTNKTLTLNENPTGVQSSISIKDAYHIDFEATRSMYWVHFRGEIGVKTVSFCLGGEMTGGISEITFPSTISNKLRSLSSAEKYSLQSGDRVSIYNEKDAVVVYLKKNIDTKYRLWFRLETDGFLYTSKDDRILGFMPGISSSEIISGQNNLVLKDAKIQKGKGYINAPTLNTHIYNTVIDMASNTPLNHLITDVKVGSNQYTLVLTRADGTTKTLNLTTPNNNPSWV